MATNLQTLLTILDGSNSQDRSDPWPKRPAESVKSNKPQARNYPVQTVNSPVLNTQYLSECSFYHPETFNDFRLNDNPNVFRHDTSQMYLHLDGERAPFMVGPKENVPETELVSLIHDYTHESVVPAGNSTQERAHSQRQARFMKRLKTIEANGGRYVLGTQKVVAEISRYDLQVREPEFAKFRD